MKITKEEALKILEEDNYRLAKILKEMNVSKINMICCGNSISSGFSFSHFTKPLLFRNESIEKILEKNSIDLSRYHFARAEDNNDEHVYSWLINDVKLSDICKMNRFDLVAMKSIGVDENNIDELYPLDDETTLKQLLDQNSSNVIIYNGATGSFLDNVTRGGKHFLTYGIKRDCIGIEAFLKYIQEYNRFNGRNIQVYLCGAPKLLKTSDIFINTKLKKISEKYANVTYIENIPKKLIYTKTDGGKTPDMHYDEIEYLTLNNQIISSITENYLINEILINIDTLLYSLNTNYQMGSINKEQKDELANKVILDVLREYEEQLYEQGIDLIYLLTKIKNYLLSRTPYDFYYMKKDNIKENVKEIMKKIK